MKHPLTDQQLMENNRKVSKILINEVIPRANKLGLSVEDFCSSKDLAIVALNESLGNFTRHDTRLFLDRLVDHHLSKKVEL